MRRNSRIDRNQPEIIAALRALGATVQSLCAVRDGVPDLLVGIAGQNFLLEVKDGLSIPSRQKLTTDEEDWHKNWRGHVRVVRSVEEAERAIYESLEALA